MLDAHLVERLEQEAETRHLGLSELIGGLLARELRGVPGRGTSLRRFRRLRACLAPMPDSAEIVREDRGGGR